MRFVICLVLCLFVATSIGQTPNEAALQALYNGFFEQGGLADPTTILACYDDSSATLTVNFIGKVLSQLANYDVFDIQSTVSDFQNNLPQSVKDCTNGNAEYQSAQSAYGIAGLTMSQLESKVGSYAFNHLSSLHSQASSANSAFTSGDYNSVGKDGGALAQAIFGSGVGDNQADLQLMANGFWEQAGLADPTTLSVCFDEDSATLTVNFIGQLINDLANSNVNGATNDLNTFNSSLPDSVKACLAGNAEMAQVLESYNMYGYTTDELESKIESYALFHLLQLHQDASVANSDFQAGDYQAVGQQGGHMIQNVFGKNNSVVVEAVHDAQDDLQLMANGFWEQAGLADPTTLSSCFDEGTANLTVTFIGNLLNDLANSNVKAATNDLNTFNNSLPETVKTCLAGNAEMVQVLQKYNMYGYTIQQLESKIENYALFHLLQLHHDATIANSDFQAGNFKAVGQEGGSMVQNVFGKNTTLFARLINSGVFLPKDDPLQDLTQLFDGFWEQAGQADPTTAVACFDEPNALIAMNFASQMYSDLASDNLLNLPSAISTFQSQISPTVMSCLSADPEINSIGQAYGISGISTTALVAKIAKYGLLHGSQFHSTAVQLESDFSGSQYDTTGRLSGQLLQAIMSGDQF